MNRNISPLRYPGGKAKLYNLVLKILDANNLTGQTYVEPFAGGCGLALKLLFDKKVDRIVLNDIDPAIYSFWYCVLNYTDELNTKIKNSQINVDEWRRQKNVYLNPDEYSVIDYAFSTFFLNRTNVSGIIKGGIIGGESQDGKYKINARFNKETLIERINLISKNKEKIELHNLDVNEFLNKILRRYYKVLIYFDPPYVSKGSKLYTNSFKEKDHLNLFNNISKCKRKWIATYDICDLIYNHYKIYKHSIIDIDYCLKNSRKANEYIFFSDNLIIPSDMIVYPSSNQVLHNKRLIMP